MLNHLYLAGNAIGNSGISMVSDALKENDRILDLDLTNNDITGSIGAEAIFEMIEASHNNIKKIMLCKN